MMAFVKDKPKRSRKKTERPFHEEVFPLIEESSGSFLKIIRSYTRFHFLFTFFLALEVLTFSVFYPLYSDTPVLAASCALFFFTLFCYLILRVWYLGKKGEQMELVRDYFLMMCQDLLPSNQNDHHYHTSLSYGLRKFAESLESKEYSMRLFPKILLDTRKLTAWWYWYDFLKMKELLIQAVVQEHLEMVKKSPVNLDVHASLANSYVLLASLYRKNKRTPTNHQKWMEDKFRQVTSFAVEEYKILEEYAPNDPWIHAQLAYIYRELNMPTKEIQEYETIVRLRPADLESLFHLGSLYYAQGANARGLQVFESLKQFDERRAEELMAHYGSHLY